MDFTLDQEQQALRDAAADLLGSAYADVGRRREVTAQEPGFSEKVWSALADMGVLGLPYAEADGGMGAGQIEVGLVAEEIGRALAPEPYVEVVVLAGSLVAELGDDEQRARLLGGIAEGRTVVAYAHVGEVTAAREVDRWVVDGTVDVVVEGGRADALLVRATVDAVPAVFVVDPADAGVARTSFRRVDGGRAARVVLSSATATPLGEPGADASPAIDLARARAQVAYARESFGVMAKSLDLTCDYLRTRKQFGVPLKTFQALTFRAADMYVQLESARSIALWASMVVADDTVPVAEATDAATRAGLQVGRAGRHIGQEAIQLHGGIGMTAEHIVGHCTARLTVIEHLLGDARTHLGRLAATVADHDLLDPLA